MIYLLLYLMEGLFGILTLSLYEIIREMDFELLTNFFITLPHCFELIILG